MPGRGAMAPTWRWCDGVLYEIYPRSFADANGDGVGDLRGIVERLDHLAWLGVSGVWLNPIHPSPNTDWGYDVADYRGVHPELGTLSDVDELVAQAGRRGIAVLLDLVPNHTSDRHPWFRDALAGGRHRDYYVWADGRSDGRPPNNWRSTFGGAAWTYDEGSGQWYLHNFLAAQPDLNWWNDEVRQEFDDILRFWFDRGVAGFRIDVSHAIVKDRELRDDLAARPEDHPHVRRHGLRRVFSMHRPEVHDVLRRWRVLAATYDPERILLGETYVLDLDRLIPYFGDGDELHSAFNFLFVHEPFRADALRRIVEGMEARLPWAAWPVWIASTHDAGRFQTRWCGEDPARVRCALMLLLTLRGTPFLYYGDEIGMADVPTDPATALDPVARQTGDPSRNRDAYRTPMQWTGERGAGFTTADATPWLPIGDAAAVNVAAQRDDPGSVLHFARDLIALRRASDDLRAGAYVTLPAPQDAWAYRRGAGTVVALNLSDREASFDDLAGTIAIGTDRGRDGERVGGPLRLRAWEGAVIDT